MSLPTCTCDVHGSRIRAQPGLAGGWRARSCPGAPSARNTGCFHLSSAGVVDDAAGSGHNRQATNCFHHVAPGPRRKRRNSPDLTGSGAFSWLRHCDGPERQQWLIVDAALAAGGWGAALETDSCKVASGAKSQASEALSNIEVLSAR